MRTFAKILIVTAFFSAVAGVSACNTFEGVGKDLQEGGSSLEKAAETRPDSVVANDRRIAADIRQAYAAEPDLAAANIRVSVYYGKVTLDGNVRSQEAQDRAINLTRSVDGVKKVVSRITVIVE